VNNNTTMLKINKFIILCLTIACFLTGTMSFAQPPSWKFQNASYTGATDSGIYYCITTDGQFNCAPSGTSCASLSSPYVHYWIHLRNLLGADMVALGYTTISKVEIVIESVFPDGGSEYLSVCNPEKNFGNSYPGNGFIKPWNASGLDGYLGSIPTTFDSTECKDLSYIYAETDYTITFTPPSGGGNCTNTSSIDYRIYQGDHWMVSLCDKDHKLRLIVHVVNPSTGAEYLFSGLPLIFEDFQVNPSSSCPSCSQCASTCN
jgi:hypothetical protein